MRRIRNNNEYPQRPEDGVVAEEAFEQVDDAQLVLEVVTKLVGVMPPYGT